MIDDYRGDVAVDAPRGQVDLYGYTSIAVATLQLQARQIEKLERELATLRSEMASVRRGSKRISR
jgi:hypothetical protein